MEANMSEKFYCQHEEVEDFVNTKECEELCPLFGDCFKDGRFQNIEDSNAANAANKDRYFAKISKRIQRAWEHIEDPDMIKTVRLKISGACNYRNEKYRADDFKHIIESMALSIDPELISNAANWYERYKEIWSFNLSMRSAKKKLGQIRASAEKLAGHLDDLGMNSKKILQGGVEEELKEPMGNATRSILNPIFDEIGLPAINSFQLMLYRLGHAIRDENFKTSKTEDIPQVLFIRELTTIYENSTSKKASSTCNLNHNQISEFVRLAADCFRIIEGDSA